jgi:enoyl-CoA hydratase/carnithine racemase
MQTISYEQVGAVGWLRLNRPERLNAMTTEMWAEMAKLGESLGDDASLRCLVVIGEGRAFSSGIDVEHLLADGAGLLSAATTPKTESPSSGRGMEDKVVSKIGDLQEAYTWLADAPYPTIAAMRGFALGGGLQLALACDLRIAARGTKMGLLEHKYGILPDLGGTYWLPRIVGQSKAKELIFTAEMIDAEESSRRPPPPWLNGSPGSHRSPSGARSGPSTRRITNRSARACGRLLSARLSASARPTSSRP